MGACLSTSTRSTCSSRSNGETRPSPRVGLRFCGRKRTKRTFSDHAMTLQHLGSIPNRIFANGKSTSSCIFTQQGRKGINQDAMLVWEDFMTEDVTFCGVFDGHGPHGHLVARKVRDTLPVKLMSFLNTHQSRQDGSGQICCKGNSKRSLESGDLEKDGSTEEEKLDSMWREAFTKSYKSMDKELKSHPNLDCFCSGSTSVTIVKQGSNLFMGYIGDSRAIMGSKDSNDSMVAIQLTVDLKPDLPREAERIKRCKGRVFALQDEPEVPRVWLPFDDAPGLAMARAFGDFCLKEYGVWDVLSNEEVVEIVSTAPTRSSAARLLVDSAAREWKLKYPTSKMDDCAVVCLFLDGKMDSESSDCEEQGFSSATFHSNNHSGNVAESDDGQQKSAEPCLQRNFTVRSSEENDAYSRLAAADAGNDGVAAGPEDEGWSGLEGVTRVNSLVQLPRFSGERPST
ncbi:Probable protein phosphatase 2C 52 [Linum grandiflorum]